MTHKLLYFESRVINRYTSGKWQFSEIRSLTLNDTLSPSLKKSTDKDLNLKEKYRKRFEP